MPFQICLSLGCKFFRLHVQSGLGHGWSHAIPTHTTIPMDIETGLDAPRMIFLLSACHLNDRSDHTVTSLDHLNYNTEFPLVSISFLSFDNHHISLFQRMLFLWIFETVMAFSQASKILRRPSRPQSVLAFLKIICSLSKAIASSIQSTSSSGRLNKHQVVRG